MKLHGIYSLLVKLPIWATTAIFATILMTVLVGRDIMEGLMYNVAYSSMVGDIALMVVVLIAATILQRSRLGFVYVPKLLRDSSTHRLILLASVAIGATICVLTLESRSGQAMDVYHDIVIAPMFVYFAITLLPVILFNGREKELAAAIFLISLWGSLVVFDITHDRLNQHQWLVKNIDAIVQMK